MRLTTLAQGTALTVKVDRYGRYHLPCAAVPDLNIGSNLIIKLDERTLPTGFRMTTENPRVIRVTRGKAAKANFGAQIDRIVRLDLNRCAFQGPGTDLTRESKAGMEVLLGTLHQSRSRLRIAYRTHDETPNAIRARKRYLEDVIEAKWRNSGGPYALNVEVEIVRIVGGEALNCAGGHAQTGRSGQNVGSGEILGLGRAAGGLPAGSREVVGEDLARFTVKPGVRLYRAPDGSYFYVNDPTAPGSPGLPKLFGSAPQGTRIVDPASVGLEWVPPGMMVVQTPDGRLHLTPQR